VCEDTLCRWINLAEKLRSVSRVVETDLNATDPSEQADDGELSMLYGRPWMRYA
jgi:hypothetical protein